MTLKLLPDHSEHPSDLSGIFPVLSLPIFGNSDTTKTISSVVKPLSVLPTVREHSRHDRDSYPINDHQRDLDAHNDPCAFHE